MTVRRIQYGTPLVRVSLGGSPMWLKLECLLPSGSAFDRIAWPLLDEMRGELRTDRPAVVAGSGSQCLAFASAARAMEIPIIAVCPESTLPEHIELLGQHRIELIRTPKSEGYLGTDARAREVLAQRGGVLVYSPRYAERAAHHFERSLGQELGLLLSRLGSERPEVMITPVGSGALLIGVMAALGSAGHRLDAVGTVLDEGAVGSTHQDGVSPLSAAPNFGGELIAVSDSDAAGARADLAKSEGILVGLASAGAVHVGRQLRDKGRRAMVIVVDAGDRYFSVDRKLGAQAERPV